MEVIKKKYSATYKFNVVMAALKEDQTISEIASKFKVHPTQIKQWKKRLYNSSLELFGAKKSDSSNREFLISQLYEEIGRLKFELDWVKKSIKFNGVQTKND